MSRPLPVFRTLFACLLLALLLHGAHSAMAQEQSRYRVFEQAEYVISDSRRVPPDTAPWQPVTLPDNWYARDREFSGTIWYRIRFDRVTTNAVHAHFLPRMSAGNIRIMVNDIPFGTTNFRVNPSLTGLQQGSLRPIPTQFIKPTDNVMHIRVTGDARFRHGLTRIVMGAGEAVIPMYRLRDDLQRTAPAALGAMLLLMGVVAMVLWYTARKDPVLFWFSLATLSSAAWIMQMVWPPELNNERLQDFALFSGNFLYVTPVIILCRRVAGKGFGWGEIGLWSLFAAGCVAAVLTPDAVYPVLATVASIAYVFLLAGVLAWITTFWWNTRRWQSLLLAVAVLVLIALNSHDLARWMGYVDYDNLLTGPFAAPFLMLALGITILDRHLRTARALASSNQQLELRVQEKIREAELAHEKIREVMRDQAVLRERQRLMADMHDGLGSNLVSLISATRSGKLDAEELARQLDETLRDLHAIVDSLQPVEDDLGVVLGNIRYRMAQTFEAAGITLHWDIAELPPMPGLTPEIVLSIQRVLLEALSNAIRHSRAKTIAVKAWFDQDKNQARVEITDDGTGFDVSAATQGHGLRNMTMRAERAGIKLDICSAPGTGTSVTLTLPPSLAQSETGPVSPAA